MSNTSMTLNLKIWRQQNEDTQGKFVDYKVADVSPDMSFLEMIDVLNEQLVKKGEDAIAFDHDCREGICGMCGAVVNGQPHGPVRGTTLCQLHMRHFHDGQIITIEPWRSKGFPIAQLSRAPRTGMVVLPDGLRTPVATFSR